jgi:hypothetical protein
MNQKTTIEDFTLLSYIIGKILAYPIQIQYVLFEILTTIKNRRIETLNFLFFKLPIRLEFRSIDEDWARNFIERACSHPYLEVLLKFNQSERNLREILEEVTPRIYLIEMPENLSGLNLKAQSIVIELFSNEEAKEGGSFFVYLNDLAHYLRRVDCKYIKECNSPKSDCPEYPDIKEGGQQLEMLLFGDLVFSINEEALKFLLKDNSQKTLDIFQEKFKKKNMKKLGQKRVLLRKSCDNTVIIGDCGSQYNRETIEEIFRKSKDLNNV